MLNRNDLDNYITGHYGNDQELADEPEESAAPPPVTPASAIQSAIFDLCHERRRWKDQDDPNGVRPWIEQRIAALEQVQRALAELRRLKAALRTLREG